jgi:ABC-2 type transport system permease protein
MRNLFLIAKREYVTRVRSKSFLIMTLLVPVLMGALTIGPGLLTVALMKQGAKHFVVVTSRQSVGQAIKARLSESQERESKRAEEVKIKNLKRGAPTPPSQVTVDVDTNTSAEERAALTEKVRKKELDGVIWATDDALAANKLPYVTLDVSSFIQTAILQESISEALHRESLKAKGLNPTEIDAVFKRVELDPQNAKEGGPGAADPQVTFISTFVMVMILYISLLLYGINVMRSVLEEKTTRIIEVMLSIAQPKEMMAGKILGVGSVGLTQFAIWAGAAAVLSSIGVMITHAPIKIGISGELLFAFPVFFLLGYALYSTMYAAVGAMVNSEQEAQQASFLVLMPIIAAITIAFPVLQSPNTPVAFWGSMIPFTSPIIMFIRIAVSPPPAWQIGLSITINVATIYGLVLLCARIYRVGILMYGKKPTLPEIIKWLKYA